MAHRSLWSGSLIATDQCCRGRSSIVSDCHARKGYPSSSTHALSRRSKPKRVIAAPASMVDVPGLSGDEAGLTWQVMVGFIAGVAPFVVAGIEFSKRIAVQKRCNVCGGSGLVKRDQYYFRCYGCGGFLPWQSWRRFFTGK